jgi:hypothetical protein
MRVSAGFCVVGLSGKTLIQTLPAALDLARHRDAGSLDLAVGDPTGLEGLQPVVAELHGRLALRIAAPPAALVLAVLGLLRSSIYCQPFPAVVSRSVRRVVSGASRQAAGSSRPAARPAAAAALCRRRRLVGARPLDVVLAAPARPRGLPRPAATLPATTLASALASRPHRTETFTITLAIASALA